jgi:hypothetical protein
MRSIECFPASLLPLKSCRNQFSSLKASLKKSSRLIWQKSQKGPVLPKKVLKGCWEKHSPGWKGDVLDPSNTTSFAAARGREQFCGKSAAKESKVSCWWCHFSPCTNSQLTPYRTGRLDKMLKGWLKWINTVVCFGELHTHSISNNTHCFKGKCKSNMLCFANHKTHKA